MKTIVSVLLASVATLVCSTANAQQILYSNSFNGGATTINGTAPTVATNVLGATNTALWKMTYTGALDGGWLADGAIGTNAGSVLLPFKPQAGAVYYLTASLTMPASTPNWIGLGFAVTNISGTNQTSERFSDSNVKGGPWFLVQTPGVSEQFFGGPSATLETDSGNVITAAGTYNLTIILNTLSTKWSASAFVGGTLAGTNVVGGKELGTNIVYGTNPSIGFFGMTEQQLATTTGIQWNNIALSTALAPIMSQQPVSAAVDAGSAFTNVAAAVADTNGGTLFYQWYTNDVAAIGQTKASLILNPVSIRNASTNVYVVVTNTYGAVTSSVVAITVYTDPAITGALPISYTNPFILFGGSGGEVGSSPTFSVSTLGGVPLGYQWYGNGAALTGATSSSFTVTNTQTTSPTTFSVVASNTYGLATNSWSVTYQPTPVAAYPQAVLSDMPIAFWRLNEQGSGTGDIADDYAGGNNGIYTNVALSQAGYNAAEQSEPSAGFGLGAGSSAISQIEGVDFAAASGVNAEFTVEAWVQGVGATIGAPIVSEGVYGSSDAFALGVDTNSSSGHYRFYVRSAGGTVYTADSSVGLDFNWHHLVGVCDEANGAVSLYIDGTLAATAAIPTKVGEYEANAPLVIGAGTANTNQGYTLQFYGYLADVSAYDYALSAAQVATHYGAVGNIGPVFVQTPPNGVTNDAGVSLTLPATLTGTPPLGYYWTDVNAGTNLASGSTNGTQLTATLTVPSVPANWNGDQLELTVTNAYGSTNYFVNLTVLSGSPQIVTDVQSPFYVALGGTAFNSIAVSGSTPYFYQWQFNGNNLAGNGRISGTQTSALTITAAQSSDAGNYQVVVSNSLGSVTSSIAPLKILNDLPVSFNGNGAGWTSNQLGTFTKGAISNGVLTLTDGGASEARTFFFDYPQYIAAFQASFTYQVGGAKGADGMAFVIQNDPRGIAALGHDGGQLGVGTPGNITDSAELELDIYPADGIGFTFHTNGVTGTYATPGSVNLVSGDPINVGIYYASGRASVTFTDSVNSNTFSTNLIVGDLTQAVGGTNTAYVGFTGGDGGVTSIQTISNFTFVSLPAATIQLTNSGAVISWPSSIIGFTLQETSDVSTGTWFDVTNTPTVSGGQNQVVLPAGGSNEFYRLVLP